MNREQWLTDVATELEERFFKKFTLGKYRVTCGWPHRYGLSQKVRRIGECHAAQSSTDGSYEIFISPLLDKPLQVTGVLCHELAHIAAGIGEGHGPVYKMVCNHIGLTKNPPTQAAPGPKLEAQIKQFLKEFGKYPHKAMDPVVTVEFKPIKDLRVRCVKCGCRMTLTVRWLEKSGLPTCGCGGKTEIVVPGEEIPLLGE